MATQTVTILFTDLVGSTELSSRLGPENTESLRQIHFGLLRGAIDAAGGTEVKNLGDGLMVAFTSLSRALACSVGMQQAIERHNQRGKDTPLSIRIGIATGEATEEDGDFFGDPVVEAARLCAGANGGQILATEVVKLMAGRHATQEFLSVGDRELKGIPDPVPTVEVVWEPATGAGEEGGRMALPARLVGASAESLFAFFGRADELERMVQAQKSAREGRVRVTLISGEPGIGKTTLVAQAARSAHAEGTNVVYGGCEDGLSVPYQPWITALSQLVEHADEAILRELVERRGPAVARLVPDLARRLSMVVADEVHDADAERFLLLEGATRLLAALSAESPVMVVLDDLHWVDAASLQLLRHVVASGLPMSVHVVGTFRESDLSRGHPLVGVLADLRREAGVERIDLVGLDDVDIVELLGAAAGHEVAGDGVALAHALRRETAGNPFFVVEVIRHLAETGAFTQNADGRWVVAGDLDELGLPSSVREVVAHRVERLGEPMAQALSAAAVIGRDFDVDLLAALLDRDENDLLDLLEGATAAGLITEPEHQFGRYRFVHALIQHTLYTDLSAPRRQRTHQRVAEALEARTGIGTGAAEPVEELARHWMAATRPADATKALHYARRAGDIALAAHAPLDAINWYTQALELHDRHNPNGDDERARLLVDLGTAQRQAGQPEHRETHRDAGRIALRLADRDLLVSLALSRDPGMDSTSEVDPDRLAVIDAALDAAGADDSTDRARLLACLAEEIDPRDVVRRSEVAAEAIDVARRVGDEATLLAVLILTFHPLLTPDTLERRLEEGRAAIGLAERIGDPASRFDALANDLYSLVESGDLVTADRRLDEMEALVEQTRLPAHRCRILLARSWRHLLAGRVADSEADMNAWFEIGSQIGLPWANNTFGGQLMQIAMQRGGLEDMVELVARGFAENPSIPAWRTAVMQVYCELGRYDDATELFDLGSESGFSDLPFDVTWYLSTTTYADCAVDLSRTEAAAVLYERLAPYERRFICLVSVDRGFVARPLGRLATLLERYDDAEAHLGAALAMHERFHAPYWIARTQIDLAELCIARQQAGDDDRARSHLATAQLIVNQFGYGGLQPRINRFSAA